jgi:uncharacterized protein (DUF2267 family)
MRDDTLIAEIAQRGGVDPGVAERAAHATLAVLAERLIAVDRASLASLLPTELATVVEEVHAFVQYGIDGFYERVARRLGGPRGSAIELAQVVCAVLGDRLDPELRQRLHRHLPPAVAALLEPEPLPPAPPPRHPTAPGTTLATGRPGSSHPVSEAPANRAQAGSIAASPEPHADRKLSSGHVDAGRPIAEASPGSTRPLDGTPR